MTAAPLQLRIFVKKSTPAPVLFWKFLKTPTGVHFYTPAHVHLVCMSLDEPRSLAHSELNLL